MKKVLLWIQIMCLNGNALHLCFLLHPLSHIKALNIIPVLLADYELHNLTFSVWSLRWIWPSVNTLQQAFFHTSKGEGAVCSSLSWRPFFMVWFRLSTVESSGVRCGFYVCFHWAMQPLSLPRLRIVCFFFFSLCFIISMLKEKQVFE